MKRSALRRSTKPLKRNKPLRKTRLKHKPRKHDNPQLRQQYRNENDKCHICRETNCEFEIHHIIGGARRIDDKRNFLFLCRECHDDFGRWEYIALQLAVKWQRDFENWDFDYLCELKPRLRVMKTERWNQVMSNDSEKLTEEELQAGWHFCPEWDDLIVGPGMMEQEICCCFEKTDNQ